MARMAGDLELQNFLNEPSAFLFFPPVSPLKKGSEDKLYKMSDSLPCCPA